MPGLPPRARRPPDRAPLRLPSRRAVARVARRSSARSSGSAERRPDLVCITGDLARIRAARRAPAAARCSSCRAGRTSCSATTTSRSRATRSRAPRSSTRSRSRRGCSATSGERSSCAAARSDRRHRPRALSAEASTEPWSSSEPRRDLRILLCHFPRHRPQLPSRRVRPRPRRAISTRARSRSRTRAASYARTSARALSRTGSTGPAGGACTSRPASGRRSSRSASSRGRRRRSWCSARHSVNWRAGIDLGRHPRELRGRRGDSRSTASRGSSGAPRRQASRATNGSVSRSSCTSGSTGASIPDGRATPCRRAWRSTSAHGRRRCGRSVDVVVDDIGPPRMTRIAGLTGRGTLADGAVGLPRVRLVAVARRPDGVDKRAGSSGIEEEWGAGGRSTTTTTARLLGSMQYGPSGLFPRAARAAGRAAVGRRRARHVRLPRRTPATPWVMQSLFLAAIGEARDTGREGARGVRLPLPGARVDVRALPRPPHRVPARLPRGLRLRHAAHAGPRRARAGSSSAGSRRWRKDARAKVLRVVQEAFVPAPAPQRP